MITFLVLFVAAFWAGIQNALAGGGSFITLPALLLTGLDARAANITSTLALFPGQVTTGFVNRKMVSDLPDLSFKALFGISLVGGLVGAVLLLATPSSIFEFLLPFLVLMATGLFAWGSFFRKPGGEARRIGKRAAAFLQFLIAIYGGYFGGGIGILMLAALTLAGLNVRNAGATKNVLAAVMNASAVAVFVFSADTAWLQVLIAGVAAAAGGQVGAYALKYVNEKLLRVAICCIGFGLTIGLFVRAYG